ncbi:MAG: VOC family protein [Bacteroidota bacterium]
MKKVTGIGGIFFKSQDPKKIKEWYGEHLGLNTDDYGAGFQWLHADNPEEKGFTQWSPFKADTKYFEPSQKEFMINYTVEDLEALVEQLKAAGVTICDEMEVVSYGKFIHIMDPDGNKIQLWQPLEHEDF